MRAAGGRRRAGLAVTGGAGVVLMLVSGCTGDGGTGQLAGSGEAVLEITPATGTQQVRPDGPIEVRAKDGKLTGVTVQGEGATIAGELAADKKSWRSSRTLTPGTSYTVTAQGDVDGETTTATSTFTTLKASRTLQIVDVTPNVDGEKVGVGMPIFVRFNRAVTDRAAVERSLKVAAQKPVEGAWRWVAPDQVIYRTKTYWQPHQTVRFHAQLAGVNAGGGAYGAKDAEAAITIGAEQKTVGDLRKHSMTVYRDGQKVRRLPFSAGKATTREYTTTSGNHLLMSKATPVTMISPGREEDDPEYYKLVVDHGVRFTNSGMYTHSAPWSVGSQGRANVSSGCINLSPSDAKWYYDIMQRGDVLKLTGSSRALKWDNGWGYWQLSWDKWRAGSALHTQQQQTQQQPEQQPQPQS